MKTSHFNILIQDTDQYFAQGLTALLQFACLHRQTTATFLTKKNAYLADLMIVSDDTPSFIWAYHATARNTRQTVLLIQDRVRCRKAPSGLHEVAVIQRNDNTNTVLQLVKLAFKKHNDRATNNVPYRTPALTAREHQVLSALAQGHQPNQIAIQLGLKVKTISGYKCTAMRKLGFSRNHELYHWLFLKWGMRQNLIGPLGATPASVSVPM